MRISSLLILLSLAPTLSFADGPRDNIPDNVRPIPPEGIEVSEADRKELDQGLQWVAAKLVKLREVEDEQTRKLIPDVEIFYRAVHDALKYNEFFAPADVKNAKEVLKAGADRAEQLLAGESPWTTQTGLVVRGFRSKLDQTVQPYGLVIPESYTFSGKDRFRLDLWFHGRGERLSENNFIAGRMKQVGRLVPQDTIVLHPYGRYSNAFKFAGEVDVLEALDHAKQHYRIDDDRVAVRGFSMGGAGCWQMAVHYPDLFFAANPGAGFSETPEFLKFFQKETLNPTWYEKKLWQWYDCPGYAMNFYNLPLVAYSGELDIQKQAADIMEEALAGEKLSMVHVIGPQTKHSIHPDSLRDIEERLAGLAEEGRPRLPRRVEFATFTLKYNRMHWVEITGLNEHWKQARVVATFAGFNRVKLETQNVRGLSLSMPAGTCPFNLRRPVLVEIDGETFRGPQPGTDRSWNIHIYNGDQSEVKVPIQGGLVKRKDLQGPIDDAFMDSFIVVRPTGEAAHELIGKWTQSELEHCIEHWRKHFRGDAIVKDDTEVTEADIASANLILFGDRSSNQLIGKIAKDLPIQWTSDSIIVGETKHDASHHAPVLIYPNPLNQNRYVVLNSGFTYREFAYLNNARQVPKLPDWAVVDLRTPADSLWPGKIVAADFFDEQWELKAARQ
jgi:pimeloyl-ACP methyl ester carboxylesterase